eukprot:TRINITY_DN63191_c0_g1_i1.p3 TRINITY_DN63191_c0_g1~~TRINITY_DN63191_c0_g1_i1.p3  ORF type:complete len:107 (+),score=28.88 TRINITY_DN63191_c0_g1_i1:787-1107(+)
MLAHNAALIGLLIVCPLYAALVLLLAWSSRVGVVGDAHCPLVAWSFMHMFILQLAAMAVRCRVLMLLGCRSTVLLSLFALASSVMAVVLTQDGRMNADTRVCEYRL